jgi:Transposase DDE domain/Helix-turn-helix of DDE superfamily endonuclease
MTVDGVIGLSSQQLAGLASRLRSTQQPRRGRDWALPLQRRVGLVCAALRTNLTLRELAAVFAISKSQVHRVVADLTPQLAALMTPPRINRHTWIVDGTLIPTRDHTVARKSKNYRWSCNAQILVRALDLHVLAVSAGGSGNRNDVVHYRGSPIEALCRAHGRVLADGGYRGIPELRTPAFRGGRVVRDGRWRRHRRRRARVEHAIARLKDWRVLRDHRRRGGHVEATIQAVAFLHNLRLEMRDRS